jgi:hypothetical protein
VTESTSARPRRRQPWAAAGAAVTTLIFNTTGPIMMLISVALKAGMEPGLLAAALRAIFLTGGAITIQEILSENPEVSTMAKGRRSTACLTHEGQCGAAIPMLSGPCRKRPLRKGSDRSYAAPRPGQGRQSNSSVTIGSKWPWKRQA